MEKIFSENNQTFDQNVHLILQKIDETILQKYFAEPNGLLSGSGGAALYFKYRFLQTQQPTFLDKALEILEKEIEKEIEKANINQIDSYLSIGSSSVDQYGLSINSYP